MSRSHFVLVAPLLAFSACTSPTPVGDDAQKPPEKIVRQSGFYTGTSEKVGDLLTPVITMEKAETGQTVELIGMIHLADRSFYEGVAAECAKADRTLLEGVRGSPSLSPLLFVEQYVFGITRRTTYYTELSSQGDAFVPPANARNGDVSLSEWQEQMPWYSPLAQTLLLPIEIVIWEPLNVSLWAGDLLTQATFTNDSYALRVRDVWASVLTRDEDGEDSNDTLMPGVLTYRNEKLLERVDEAFKDEKIKTIALPWGAAHLADLQADLVQRGFKVKESHWQRCWSVASAIGQQGETPSWFYIPFVVHYREQNGGHVFALALDTIYYGNKASGASRFDLVWELLFSSESDPKEDAFAWRFGPKLFDRPLLIERERKGESSKWRFLLFGNISL